MSSRFLFILLAAGAMSGAPALPAQIRPLPRETIRLPELAIVEVRRFGDATDPIRLNESVPVEVMVRNTGRATAQVRAGTPNDRAARGQPLILYGPVRSIPAGATVSLPIELQATGNRFRGDRFETTIFLYQPPSANDGPLGRLFRDGNTSDNEYRVSFGFERPRTYDVAATLYHLFVIDDCDNVSEGEWFVHFTLAEVHEGAEVQRTDRYWPGKDKPRDVDTRSHVALDQTLRLTGVRPTSQLLLTVSAVDCDADTPFAWPLTVPAASLSQGLTPTTTGPAYAFVVKCTGEEIFEASGGHDKAGAYVYLLPPRQWQGSTGDIAHTSSIRHECSDSSSPAYRASVRLEATIR